MTKISVTIASLLAAAVLVAGTPADAKGPGWKSGGGSPHGFNKGRKLGWGSADVPPGWNKGRRRGWDSSTYPPGWRSDRVRPRDRAPAVIIRP